MRGRIAILALLLAAGSSLAAAAVPEPCADADGRRAYIGPDREADVRTLFAPHIAGEPLAGHDGWRFDSIGILGSTLVARLEGPDGQEVRLHAKWRQCEPDAELASPSFAMSVEGTPREPALTLAEAVRRNDAGRFWKKIVEPKPPEPDYPQPGEVDGPPEETDRPSPPFNETVLALFVVIGLAFGFWLIDLPAVARDLGLNRPGAARDALWLLALTAAAYGLRELAHPTFVREAYAFPGVFFTDHLYTSGPLSDYPGGPTVIASILHPLFGVDGYDTWFSMNVLMGTLSVPMAFIAGGQLAGSSKAGLATAALLAFWPQHVRISASESTHAVLVFFVLMAAGAAIAAARHGRFRSFLVLLAATAAAVASRPEGGMAIPGLAILALAAGPGVRRRLLHPAWIGATAGMLWLIGPQVIAIVAGPSIGTFDPGASTTESLDFSTIWRTVAVLVSPGGENGIFDVETTPLWLYPLAIYGIWRLVRAGQKGAAIGLAVLGVLFFAVYSGMPPAVTIWSMGRYHASVLPAAVLLAGYGLWVLLEGWIATERGQLRVAVAVGAVGVLLYWPAIAALPLDWQRGHEFAVELGRRHPQLHEPGVRIVVPDNRRRFLDMSPRGDVEPLTSGQQGYAEAVTIAHAFEALHVDSAEPPAYYFEGIFCFIAVDPGENKAPQCEAMHQAFELEPVETLTITEGPYLDYYKDRMVEPPFVLGLYRIGARKLGPQEAAALLPPPREPGMHGRPSMEPPEPPLVAPTEGEAQER